MGKTLSLDLRERVLAFIVEGHSCHQAARRFGISAASAVRIRQRRRQTGSIAPAKRGRPKGSSRLEVFAGFLKTTVDRRPDITMPELAEALIQEHDMRAAPAELSRFLKHRRASSSTGSVTHIKKSLIATERRRKRVRAARYEWRHRAQPRMRLEPHRLVFIPSRQIALQSPAGRGTKRR